MTISLSDFNNLSEKEKKKTLDSLKKEIGVGGMVKEWDISRSKVYSMLHEFDIAVSSRKHKLKPQKPTKTSVSKKQDKSDTDMSSQADDSQTSGSEGMKKKSAAQSELDFGLKDDSSKFSLYLETQGTASFINETVQNLLGSQQLEGSNLQVNISLQEI